MDKPRRMDNTSSSSSSSSAIPSNPSSSGDVRARRERPIFPSRDSAVRDSDLHRPNSSSSVRVPLDTAVNNAPAFIPTSGSGTEDDMIKACRAVVSRGAFVTIQDLRSELAKLGWKIGSKNLHRPMFEKLLCLEKWLQKIDESIPCIFLGSHFLTLYDMEIAIRSLPEFKSGKINPFDLFGSLVHHPQIKAMISKGDVILDPIWQREGWYPPVHGYETIENILSKFFEACRRKRSETRDLNAKLDDAEIVSVCTDGLDEFAASHLPSYPGMKERLSRSGEPFFSHKHVGGITRYRRWPIVTIGIMRTGRDIWKKDLLEIQSLLSSRRQEYQSLTSAAQDMLRNLSRTVQLGESPVEMMGITRKFVSNLLAKHLKTVTESSHRPKKHNSDTRHAINRILESETFATCISSVLMPLILVAGKNWLSATASAGKDSTDAISEFCVLAVVLPEDLFPKLDSLFKRFRVRIDKLRNLDESRQESGNRTLCLRMILFEFLEALQEAYIKLSNGSRFPSIWAFLQEGIGRDVFIENVFEIFRSCLSLQDNLRTKTADAPFTDGSPFIEDDDRAGLGSVVQDEILVDTLRYQFSVLTNNPPDFNLFPSSGTSLHRLFSILADIEVDVSSRFSKTASSFSQLCNLSFVKFLVDHFAELSPDLDSFASEVVHVPLSSVFQRTDCLSIGEQRQSYILVRFLASIGRDKAFVTAHKDAIKRRLFGERCYLDDAAQRTLFAAVNNIFSNSSLCGANESFSQDSIFIVDAPILLECALESSSNSNCICEIADDARFASQVIKVAGDLQRFSDLICELASVPSCADLSLVMDWDRLFQPRFGSLMDALLEVALAVAQDACLGSAVQRRLLSSHMFLHFSDSSFVKIPKNRTMEQFQSCVEHSLFKEAIECAIALTFSLAKSGSTFEIARALVTSTASEFLSKIDVVNASRFVADLILICPSQLIMSVGYEIFCCALFSAHPHGADELADLASRSTLHAVALQSVYRRTGHVVSAMDRLDEVSSHTSVSQMQLTILPGPQGIVHDLSPQLHVPSLSLIDDPFHSSTHEIPQQDARLSQCLVGDEVDSLPSARQVLDDIRYGLGVGLARDSNSPLSNLQSMMTRALDRLSAGLYSKQVHFVLELIQNADDNQYEPLVAPRICFHLCASELLVECNEIGFSKENVKAICNVGESSKLRQRDKFDSSSDRKIRRIGFIGQKGIGFKSVFKVTSTPIIHSRNFHFMFDSKDRSMGYIVPIPVDPPTDWQSEIGLTRMCLPFSAETDFTQIRTGLDEMDAPLLLFLANLTEISIRIDNRNGHSYYRQMRIDRSRLDDSDIMAVSQKKTTVDLNSRNCVASDLTETIWLVKSIVSTCPVRRSLDDDGCDRVSSDTEISIAFPIMGSCTMASKSHISTSSEDQSNRRQYPVFAFLPLRHYGFRFIVQADWVIPSSREALDSSSPWNCWIRTQLPALVARSVANRVSHVFESFRSISDCSPCFDDLVEEAISDERSHPNSKKSGGSRGIDHPSSQFDKEVQHWSTMESIVDMRKQDSYHSMCEILCLLPLQGELIEFFQGMELQVFAECAGFRIIPCIQEDGQISLELPSKCLLLPQDDNVSSFLKKCLPTLHQHGLYLVDSDFMLPENYARALGVHSLDVATFSMLLTDACQDCASVKNFNIPHVIDIIAAMSQTKTSHDVFRDKLSKIRFLPLASGRFSSFSEIRDCFLWDERVIQRIANSEHQQTLLTILPILDSEFSTHCLANKQVSEFLMKLFSVGTIGDHSSFVWVQSHLLLNPTWACDAIPTTVLESLYRLVDYHIHDANLCRRCSRDGGRLFIKNLISTGCWLPCETTVGEGNEVDGVYHVTRENVWWISAPHQVSARGCKVIRRRKCEFAIPLGFSWTVVSPEVQTLGFSVELPIVEMFVVQERQTPLVVYMQSLKDCFPATMRSNHIIELLQQSERLLKDHPNSVVNDVFSPEFLHVVSFACTSIENGQSLMQRLLTDEASWPQDLLLFRSCSIDANITRNVQLSGPSSLGLWLMQRMCFAGSDSENRRSLRDIICIRSRRRANFSPLTLRFLPTLPFDVPEKCETLLSTMGIRAEICVNDVKLLLVTFADVSASLNTRQISNLFAFYKDISRALSACSPSNADELLERNQISRSFIYVPRTSYSNVEVDKDINPLIMGSFLPRDVLCISDPSGILDMSICTDYRESPISLALETICQRIINACQFRCLASVYSSTSEFFPWMQKTDFLDLNRVFLVFGVQLEAPVATYRSMLATLSTMEYSEELRLVYDRLLKCLFGKKPFLDFASTTPPVRQLNEEDHGDHLPCLEPLKLLSADKVWRPASDMKFFWMQEGEPLAPFSQAPLPPYLKEIVALFPADLDRSVADSASVVLQLSDIDSRMFVSLVSQRVRAEYELLLPESPSLNEIAVSLSQNLHGMGNLRESSLSQFRNVIHHARVVTTLSLGTSIRAYPLDGFSQGSNNIYGDGSYMVTTLASIPYGFTVDENGLITVFLLLPDPPVVKTDDAGAPMQHHDRKLQIRLVEKLIWRILSNPVHRLGFLQRFVRVVLGLRRTRDKHVDDHRNLLQSVLLTAERVSEICDALNIGLASSYDEFLQQADTDLRTQLESAMQEDDVRKQEVVTGHQQCSLTVNDQVVLSALSESASSAFKQRQSVSSRNPENMSTTSTLQSPSPSTATAPVRSEIRKDSTLQSGLSDVHIPFVRRNSDHDKPTMLSTQGGPNADPSGQFTKMERTNLNAGDLHSPVKMDVILIDGFDAEGVFVDDFDASTQSFKELGILGESIGHRALSAYLGPSWTVCWLNSECEKGLPYDLVAHCSNNEQGQEHRVLHVEVKTSGSDRHSHSAFFSMQEIQYALQNPHSYGVLWVRFVGGHGRPQVRFYERFCDYLQCKAVKLFCVFPSAAID
eukprot:ANDGO_05175.mRNA.1 hypothetical protein EMIHUDRAFT_250928